MTIHSSLSDEHLEGYLRVIRKGMAVQSHADLLRWLQGEVQHYLPHKIMLAAWGDFDSNFIRHDIVSALPGVRTAYLQPASLFPLLRRLYRRWIELGRTPCTMSDGELDILQQEGDQPSAFGNALQGMRSALLHGISDKRERYDCLYVIFSSRDKLDSCALSALEILLPYLDTALRGVTLLPAQHDAVPPLALVPPRSESYGLSERESEIMDWVRMGKTNAEIGSILCISSFTVKNHLQNIFKKLDVYNRMQAVSKIERSPRHG